MEIDEHQEMSAEELAEAYFVCPECNQLAERGRLGMVESEFMCTNCGHIFQEEAASDE